MSFFSAFGKKKSLSTTPTALQAPTTTLVRLLSNLRCGFRN